MMTESEWTKLWETEEWYCKACNSHFDRVDENEGYICAFCGSTKIELKTPTIQQVMAVGDKQLQVNKVQADLLREERNKLEAITNEVGLVESYMIDKMEHPFELDVLRRFYISIKTTLNSSLLEVKDDE